MADKQQIQTGDGSTSVQTISGQVIIGMQYTEVRALFLDLFKQQVEPLLTEAKQMAAERAGEVVDAFFERVMHEPEEVKEQLREPGVQRALVQAQIEHATYGNPEDVDLLAQLLVARMREPGKSLAAVATQAAIETMGQLRQSDLDLLSGIFLVLKVNFNAQSSEQLRAGLGGGLARVAYAMTDNQEVLRHLDATNCIAYDSTRAWQVPNNLRGTYPTAFEGVAESETLQHLAGRDAEILRVLNLFVGSEFSLGSCFLSYKGSALAHANLTRWMPLPSVRIWIQG